MGSSSASPEVSSGIVKLIANAITLAPRNIKMGNGDVSSLTSGERHVILLAMSWQVPTQVDL